MKLRYTDKALREIDNAISHIASQSPQGAQNVAARFHEILTLLEDQPFSGVSTGRKNGRRFYLKPYPYIVYYRLEGDEILVQRFRHTSRRRLQRS